ncbi:MAG: pyruvate formate lyase family protein [candidate division KSB1 bacterium]|nr:pyruvate formate lyase family protein [candidate division KSB1 bacterium]
MTFPEIGFSPQPPEGKFGYYMLDHALQDLLNDPELSAQNRRTLMNLMHYWKTENSIAQCKAAYPADMKTILPSDDYFGESGIAFTLWRMSGSQLNYSKLIRLGIPGLKAEIEEKKQSAPAKSVKLYTAMLKALDVLADVFVYYADMCETQRRNSSNPKRQQQLSDMGTGLRNLSQQKPGNFREGLQMMFMYNILSGSLNYSRFDHDLGDLYVQDIDSGARTREEALELLTGLWRMMVDRGSRYDQRMIIGGRGREHEKKADRLALAVMETSRRVRDIVPQLALRFYDGQNPQLYQTALDILAEGYTYPMLYNDDVNIPAAMQAFDIPYEEAVHVIQFGCGEYVLDHRSFGTPSAVINMLQALLVTLHKGIDPVTGQRMGLPAERLTTYNDFAAFDDLYNAYKEQIEYHVDQLARHEELEYVYAAKDAPFLYFSMLFDDCIERGKPVFDGGIRYLGGTLESYGNTNTSDALVALRELVYDSKLFTLDQVRNMLLKNFEGYERERRMMLNCPKYGNDNDTADDMLMDIDNHICNYTRQQKKNTGLHSYLIVIINNDANVVLGQNTAASPDGRRSKDYLNNGNTPMSGMDQNGVTAFLNSIVKAPTDNHAGAVQNMKFSKDMLTTYRDKLKILLQTYWQKGGAQAMLTVISREDLENAMQHPENYQNLIVRVGGFAERFVNLPPETQREILARTLY